MSDRERVEALAKVLGEHDGQPFWCACGSPTRTRSAHTEHLVTVLLDSPAMRDLLAEAKADALREAADGVPRLALSPEGVRRWLRADADRIQAER